MREVDAIAAALRDAGVEVIVVDDLPGSDVPDSVFPNNWISTHDDGRVVLYPMATPSRRRERRGDIVDLLRTRFVVREVLDLSPLERDGVYLEGTGALVLDHLHRVAYLARSGRAHETALARWCEEFGYAPIAFGTVDAAGAPIYHTNVVLSIAERFAVDLDTPWGELSDEQRGWFLHGTDGERVMVTYRNRFGRKRAYAVAWEGLLASLKRRYDETESEPQKERIEEWMTLRPCPECHGARLKPESLAVTVGGLSIHQATDQSVEQAIAWSQGLALTETETLIAERILREIVERLRYMKPATSLSDVVTLSLNSST